MQYFLWVSPGVGCPYIVQYSTVQYEQYSTWQWLDTPCLGYVRTFAAETDSRSKIADIGEEIHSAG